MAAAPLVAVHLLAGVFRFWQLDHVGFNSDEAVYAGTAASIAGDPERSELFPIFRAHPVLFQMLVSLTYHGGVSDWSARAVSALAGILTVTVTYLLGRRLYGHYAGLIAALLLAVMPYHVVVTRQVLLDGLMTLTATVVLYGIVRYVETASQPWLLAAGAAMGLSVMAKETSLVLLGGLYAFFALTPAVRINVRDLLLAVGAMGCVVAAIPIVLAGSNRTSTGGNYLLWQILRRPNHEFYFYFAVVPWAVGIGVVIAAAAGLVWLRRERTWRERLLVSWMTVPVVFFTLWPVKGYQYLLPIAPVLAVLAARTLVRVPDALRPATTPPAPGGLAAKPNRLAARLDRLAPWWSGLRRKTWFPVVVAATLVALLATSLAVPAWRQIAPSMSGTFLAGTGGLPGGREAGLWVRDNVPEGAQLLTIGPSMANVLMFYGGRRAFALSVSPNPAARNPSYVPIENPDRALREGQFQYIVWDSYTANRTSFFAEKALELVERYHGVPVYTGSVSVEGPSGEPTTTPVIIIYRVGVP
ncbi:MAG: glycosyltransferase family 39 protein [Micromonosporaceae bacterium]|nr:glycosyltransferase family 39 protein [Micromonosporaceae bacterium]